MRNAPKHIPFGLARPSNRHLWPFQGAGPHIVHVIGPKIGRFGPANRFRKSFVRPHNVFGLTHPSAERSGRTHFLTSPHCFCGESEPSACHTPLNIGRVRCVCARVCMCAPVCLSCPHTQPKHVKWMVAFRPLTLHAKLAASCSCFIRCVLCSTANAYKQR